MFSFDLEIKIGLDEYACLSSRLVGELGDFEVCRGGASMRGGGCCNFVRLKHKSGLAISGAGEFCDKANAAWKSKDTKEMNVLFWTHLGGYLAKNPDYMGKVLEQLKDEAFDDGYRTAQQDVRVSLGIDHHSDSHAQTLRKARRVAMDQKATKKDLRQAIGVYDPPVDEVDADLLELEDGRGDL